MEVEAWPLGQPVADQLRLVGAVVVQDQVDVQLRRDVLFDGVEEGAELDRTVAAMGLAEDVSCFCVERGKEAGGSVACVVVGAAFDLSGRMGSSGAVGSSA